VKLDPLINRRVVFKLFGHDVTLDVTIPRYDANGYWIRGGTVAGFLSQTSVSDPLNDVRYLEFAKIEWLRAYESAKP